MQMHFYAGVDTRDKFT